MHTHGRAYYIRTMEKQEFEPTNPLINVCDKELPSVIDEPYPHVSIGDLYEVSQALDPTVTCDDVSYLELALDAIKRDFAPDGSTFYYVGAASLSAQLESMAEAETARKDLNVGVVHLDKYIGASSSNPDFYRLDVSRNSRDELVSRVGVHLSPEEQLKGLASWSERRGHEEVVLVDDVLAFGSTVPPLIRELRDKLPAAKFRLLTGIAASGGVWRGIERVFEQTGITAEYLTKVCASPPVEGGTRGMAIPVSRDLTLFGGKTGLLGAGMQVSYPYFLPFSRPMPSLIKSDRQFEASRALLDFNDDFAAFLSTRLGRTAVVGDLVPNKFGMPHSSLKCMSAKMVIPESSTSLADYIMYARGIMETNHRAISEELTLSSS